MSSKKKKKCTDIGKNCNLIQFFKVNLHKVHCFLLLSILLCFLQLQKLFIRLIVTNFLKLDPDPHSKKLLDPDPQKMNADPKP